MTRGIDYSGPGSTANRDPETGIRYGIISMNDLGHFAWDNLESDYGNPTCPKCGGSVVEWDSDDHDDYAGRGSDYACEACQRSYMSDECYGDEPSGWTINGEDEEGFVDSSNDLWVVKSPYYTHAKFCSPCAPGACSLSSPCADGVQAYCLGHNWFDEGFAPYPVYSVETGEAVIPEGFVTVPYCSFGKPREDGMIEAYGEVDWSTLDDDVRSGSVLKISAGDEWPEDEVRERVEAGCLDYVLEVNDHGNSTLYSPDHKVVWEVV